MGYRQADAYHGIAEIREGLRVRVFYMDAGAIKAQFGPQKPLMPNRKRVGWYWGREDVVEHVGPFTSSRLALMSAIETHGGPK